jgi:delta24(24(1))-sterol reductase
MPLLQEPALKTNNLDVETVGNRWQPKKDHKIDISGHSKFCGFWGTGAMIFGFPLLMYYMRIGPTFYGGKFPVPTPTQSFTDFGIHLADLVCEQAFPSLAAWKIYWTFFLVEAAFYCYLPGVQAYGKPLDHEGGKEMKYYCSAVWSFYVSILLAAALHFTGIFKLYTIIDEFGPILSVAIISGFLVAIVAYISAWARGAQHRMTGYFVYDFFHGLGTEPSAWSSRF